MWARGCARGAGRRWADWAGLVGGASGSMMEFGAKRGVVESFIGGGEISNNNKFKTENVTVICISKIFHCLAIRLVTESYSWTNNTDF